MAKLNQDTYILLMDANPIIRIAEFKDWYELTYDIFKEAPLNNINDFWRIVAFTYSWMPTIPTVNGHLLKEPEKLLNSLRELRSGDLTSLQSVLEELIPVINNSLTGVSKVLHFVSPDTIPIIDRNVLRGWDIFFFKLHPHLKGLQLPSYKSALNRKHIPKYLAYREVLIQWVENCEGKVSLRDLELGFFELGKNTEAIIDQHPTFIPY